MICLRQNVTWVSRFCGKPWQGDDGNQAYSKDFVVMARRLLPILPVLLFSSTSCIYPIQYEAGDAGAGHKPLIVDSVPAMPGPIDIDPAGGNQTFTVDVEDRDLDDLIYLRVFRDDYDPIFPFAYANAMALPDGDAIRKVSFTHNPGAWCGGTSSGAQRLFDVWVSNQPFTTDSGKELPPGAEVTQRTWVATCL